MWRYFRNPSPIHLEGDQTGHVSARVTSVIGFLPGKKTEPRFERVANWPQHLRP